MSEPLTFRKLREELAPWSDRNFPGKQPWQPALGVVEEAGELCHAVLKASQGIRGTEDEHRALMVDAVADATIFLADAANHAGAFDHKDFDVSFRAMVDGICIWREEHPIWLAASAVAAHATVLVEWVTEESPGDEIAMTTISILESLARFCLIADIDYQAAVEETWARVKQRNWRANPETGGPT